VPLRSPAAVLSPTQVSCTSPSQWPHNSTHLSVFALRGGVAQGGVGSSPSAAVAGRFEAPTEQTPPAPAWARARAWARALARACLRPRPCTRWSTASGVRARRAAAAARSAALRAAGRRSASPRRSCGVPPQRAAAAGWPARRTRRPSAPATPRPVPRTSGAPARGARATSPAWTRDQLV
jgi:hypothetical protein